MEEEDMDMVEILNKSCIRVDERTICDQNFKEMTNAIIEGLTDTRGEFSRNLAEYREKVKRGLETIGRYNSGYIDLYAKDFIRYIRRKLGMNWRTLRGETAKSRLIKMGLPIVIEKRRRTPYFTYREEEFVNE